MDNDLSRAALAVACVFAVVLGASLFPATGFGGNPVPAGATGNGNASDGGTTAGRTGDGSANDGTDGSVEGTTGPWTATTDATTTNGTSSGDGDGGGVGTGEPQTATTPEPTTTTSSAYDDAASGGLGGSLIALSTMVLVVLVGFVSASVGLGRHHRRRNPDQWDLPSAPHLRVLEYVRRIPQTSLAFVLFAGANVPGILDGFLDGIGDARTGLGVVTHGIGSLGGSIGRGLLHVPGGFVRGIGGLAAGIGSLTLGLSSFSTGLGTGVFFDRGDDRPGNDPRRGGRSQATSDAPEPEAPDPPASVREAWDRLQDDLGVSGADGETPGEIARRAVRRGLPTDAVRSLTRAFRDVRYGGRPDDGERVSVARDAYERLRAAMDGDASQIDGDASQIDGGASPMDGESS